VYGWEDGCYRNKAGECGLDPCGSGRVKWQAFVDTVKRVGFRKMQGVLD